MRRTNRAWLILSLAVVSCGRPPARERPPLPPDPMASIAGGSPVCMNGLLMPKGPPLNLPSTRVGTAPDAAGERAEAIVAGACSATGWVDQCIAAAEVRLGRKSYGIASFELTIGAQGTASVKKGAPFELDATLGDCLASALARAPFPEEAAGTARYELKLRPGHMPRIIELGIHVEGLRAVFAARILRATYPKLDLCHEAFLGRKGSARGRVFFHIKLRQNGTVSALDVGSSPEFKDEQLLKCMASVITPLVFEPTDTPTGYIDYPLDFAIYDD